jgi:hypothetical protein
VPIPPMVAVAIPVAMPTLRLVSENVSVPVTPQMITAVSQIVCIPKSVSIPELGSGVSLVPRARDSRVAVIREWRDTIALRDSCYRVWARTRERTSVRRNVRPPVCGRW